MADTLGMQDVPSITLADGACVIVGDAVVTATLSTDGVRVTVVTIHAWVLAALAER